MDAVTEIQGEVTEVLWRNPHVRFSVRTAEGAVWDVETNSVSIIRRMDVPPGLLNVGDTIRVAGFPERRGRTAMWANNILLADGRELVTRPGAEPHWLDEALGFSDVWLAGGTDARGTAAESQGIFRVWSTHFNAVGRSLFHGLYPLTDAAAALRATYDPVRDNPTPGCTPNYTLTATAPATFTEPVTLDKQWGWRPGEIVRPFQCAAGA